MTTNIYHVEPKLGEGIYPAKDVSRILKLDYQKTYRWLASYWGSGLDENTQYTFGEVGNRAINFLSLIEFYTFFKLREKGISSTEIKKLHKTLSKAHNTIYPFAIAHNIYVDGKHKKKFVYYEYLNNLLKHDKKQQFSFRFIETFLDKIEFDDDNIAVRFFPLNNSKNVVVDPKHQFGQPTISGTNIKTSTIYSYFLGGEGVDSIARLYSLSNSQVQDAINFYSKAA